MLGKRTFTKVFLLILVIGLASCGKDNSTGPEPTEEAPSLPKLEKAEPDITFFEDSSTKFSTSENQSIANFYLAKSMVTSMKAFFRIGNMYGAFLNPANNSEATYNNGVWEWNYNISQNGNTVDIRTTAEKMSDGSIKWAMYWSVDTESITLDNYKLLEGTVTEDGKEGGWSFNSLNPETNEEVVAMTADWEITSDVEKDLTIKVYDAGTLSATITYQRNGAEYTMTIDNSSQTNNVVISWNTDTKTGSIVYEGTEKCWDSEFQDISCS